MNRGVFCTPTGSPGYVYTVDRRTVVHVCSVVWCFSVQAYSTSQTCVIGCTYVQLAKCAVYISFEIVSGLVLTYVSGYGIMEYEVSVQAVSYHFSL